MAVEELRRTPLYEVHKTLGGQVVPFAGWEMPLRYRQDGRGGDVAENRAVREGVGLFDVSHMGRVHLWGSGALSFINQLVAFDIRRVSPHQARYTVMLNEKGGIIDDLIVYPFADPNHIGLVINAGNREGDLAWMRAHQDSFNVEIEDETVETALIAVQGPEALAVLSKLTPPSFIPPNYYHFADGVMVAGAKALVSRTGYTGEEGVELWIQAGAAETVWQSLLLAGKDFGILPCGLGSRDSLRTEAGYALHGHEISPTIDPFEAGLGWVISMDKEEFIGREALLEIRSQEPLRRLAGFRTFGRNAIPRQGDMVLFDDEVVGTVVSGVFSPTFGVGIGTGFLMPAGLARTGNEVEIIRGAKRFEAEVVVPPRFYRREKS